ncbi:FHA domain-containing protein, partial [Streptomyces huiliensis]|uniref:FHA domain-containing protein n=1 Tax=Streptomyces huiliensis TaxID=2876027 RepID=UPI001CC19BF6
HDLGSTNGTTLDATPVDDRPVPFRPGALLRAGESTLVLHGPDGTDGRPDAPAPGTAAKDAGSPPLLPTSPDGEGHLRVTPRSRRPESVTRTDGPGARGVEATDARRRAGGHGVNATAGAGGAGG